MTAFRTAVRQRMCLLGRVIALFALTAAELALLGLPASAIVVPAIWPVVLLHGAAVGGLLWLWFVPASAVFLVVSRGLLRVHRRLVAEWCGVQIPDPYRERPRLERTEHGWYWNGHDYNKYRWLSRINLWLRWRGNDPATWRDLCWQILGIPLSVVVLPAAACVYGTLAVVRLCGATALDPLFFGSYVVAGAAAGAALVFAYVSPKQMLSWHGLTARWLLAPTERSRLRTRVARLTQTRTDATDAQATELRRIERDLHDGAQARLVALGLTLGAIERLLDTDPAAARELLARSREASAQALTELRDLVRGIHPPVLAERGLADALRALALDGPTPVQARIDVPGRLSAPIESAAYFAVAELLTNTAKHARAAHVTLTAEYAANVLRIEVTDDGRGGATDSAGTGLRGLRRRLGTFDGTLALDSPPGGPTRATLEIPCALSSPKTSTSSGRD
ncbi:sensor histidine kinase [Actinocatenispora rupis]|uniref:histidine kinase n=1 Tax=Actinocatenispora rupis TaxID=519421 RepID=A0A8J3J3Z0_9ACTN|nr:histidine kinase [Actinocatenispora rupis]GID11191.1 histidine kinase [Actinocatenispora rupis]